MAALLRSNPELRRLLAAWLQSCLGTGAGYVALLLLTLRDLHTSWAVSAVLLAEFLPAIAFGWWFGSLADRHSRRALIVAANLLQAGAFAAIAFVTTAAPIIALALVAGTGNALLRPALRSALPAVAGEHKQVATALYDTCRWVGITLGPAIAGGLYAISGVRLALLLNGLSFLVAAAVMNSLPLDAARSDTQEQNRSADGVRAGLREAFAGPGILTVLACSARSIIGGGLLNVCEPLLATRVLHGSGGDYALLVATYGMGMVLATTLIARRGSVDGRVLIQRYVAALTLTAVGMGGCAIVGSLLPAGSRSPRPGMQTRCCWSARRS